ncbi:unnamed protein product [Allacma fusca]|uniref:Uncharacterized protein n=1 Tax=Allacma fusca TaxID=39272 RepID=A0A8J2L6E2_9HEXA|nr:unnamed protein product [Allacma fusca]
MFFKTLGKSINYKNFHGWVVEIGNHRLRAHLANWVSIGKSNLREVWHMSLTKDPEYKTFEVAFKVVAEMMLHFNFTHMATINIHRDKLQVLVPLMFINVLLDEHLHVSTSIATVPSLRMGFLQCYSTQTHPLNILQIFKPFSYLVWTIFILVTGFLSLLYTERKCSWAERFLVVLNVLISQVPHLDSSNKLLFLWVFLTTVTSTMYLSFYESSLVSPEYKTLKTFKELSRDNYRLLIDINTTFDYWVIYNN